MKQCTKCVQDGCRWCGDSHTCLEASTTGGAECAPQACPLCWLDNADFCPSVPDCAAATDCKSCTSSQCSWCGATAQCVEALPPPPPPQSSVDDEPAGWAHSGELEALEADSGQSCDGKSCSKCFKTDASTCPDVPVCSAMTDCYNCTVNNCGWCADTQKCSESSFENDEVSCDTTACTNCYKHAAAACPTVAACSALTSCQDCTQDRCSWCGDTQTCMEGKKGVEKPCSGAVCDLCYKDTYEECPAVASCPAQKDCTSCVNGGCTWCGSTATCSENTSDDAKTSCSGKGCNVCLKHKSNQCPVSTKCADHQWCSECTADPNCGWCNKGSERGQVRIGPAAPCAFLLTLASPQGTCMEAGYTTTADEEEAAVGEMVPCRGTCPVENWSVGDCGLLCRQKEDCGECAGYRTADCGWCAGFEDKDHHLESMCLAAGDDGPRNSDYKCTRWHTGGAAGGDECPRCEQETFCQNCVAKKQCGWCDGKCTEGAQLGPFEAGVCDADADWSFTECGAPGPCAQNKNCPACAADADSQCGWCEDYSSCWNGTAAGPAAGECNANRWFFGANRARVCPVKGHCHEVLTDCTACMHREGCGWCAGEGCVEGTFTEGAMNSTCGPFNYNATAQCTSVCTVNDNCRDCVTDEGCGWCDSLQLCLLAGPDGGVGGGFLCPVGWNVSNQPLCLVNIWWTGSELVFWGFISSFFAVAAAFGVQGWRKYTRTSAAMDIRDFGAFSSNGEIVRERLASNLHASSRQHGAKDEDGENTPLLS